MQTRSALADWDAIDTVLVDMDGTLLDLAFDNYFWHELLPARWADRQGLDTREARERLAERIRRTAGTLPFYCVEHWTRDLGLDVEALKREHAHLIRFLPGAAEFLAATRARGKRVFIVTNAHRRTIAVKAERTGIQALVDGVFCSHEIGAPKEVHEFWARLSRLQPFDRERTLLVEDSLAVLDAAAAFGVRHTLAVRRPDSGKPPREIRGYASIDGVAQLIL